MQTAIDLAKELIEFIYDSPTPYQGVQNIKNILKINGFTELQEENSWHLEKGKGYFVSKNDSAIIAFIIGLGEMEEQGFKIIGTHMDSPTFRIKPNPEIKMESQYTKLNTEVYGSPILNTWLDRPLSIAGRLVSKSKNPFQPNINFINIKKPILIIPNLAIHLNRKVNNGLELNKQKDVLPVLCTINKSLEKEDTLLCLLSQEASVPKEDILDFDLFLYENHKGNIVGMYDEFISSSRLDNLAMVHAGLKAISKATPTLKTQVLVCFDNEEVGSSTKQGADSPYLKTILERILLSLEKNREDYFRAICHSFMISADMAHGIHPNSPEKHDPVHRPMINKGPVIKISANFSYSSDGNSTSVYTMICQKAKIPIQKFVNRSDERGGSTIGPVSANHLSIPTVDVGNPMLAMHSIRELCGVEDHLYIIKTFEEFYSL